MKKSTDGSLFRRLKSLFGLRGNSPPKMEPYPLPDQWTKSELLLPGTNGVSDKALYALCDEIMRNLGPWGMGAAVVVVDTWTLAIEAYMINGAQVRKYLNPVIDRKELEYFKIGFIHACLDIVEV